MSGAAKSNVLMFLTAVFALATVWLAVGAVGQGGLAYAVAAIGSAGVTAIALRAYRATLRQLDAEERRQT